MEMLNIKPEYGSDCRYKIKLIVDGEDMAESNLEDKEWHGIPLNRRVRVMYKHFELDETGDSDWEWEEMCFEPNHLKKIDDNGNKYVFANSAGSTLVLTRIKEQKYQYWDAI